MERLTYNDDGCWQVHGADQNLCKQVCEEYSNCKSCPIGRAIDRLAEYENTGLTVERATGLGKADQEGRVLQYAPGDTVYDRFGRPSVQKAPAVDPHKHGRWIIGEMGVFGCPIHCSKCGWGSDCADRDKWMHYPGHKFCGACGARMDGGEEQ